MQKPGLQKVEVLWRKARLSWKELLCKSQDGGVVFAAPEMQRTLVGFRGRAWEHAR